MPPAPKKAGRPAKQAPVPPADRMRRCRQRKKREAGEGKALREEQQCSLREQQQRRSLHKQQSLVLRRRRHVEGMPQ